MSPSTIAGTPVRRVLDDVETAFILDMFATRSSRSNCMPANLSISEDEECLSVEELIEIQVRNKDPVHV